jgi:hypothetical protein
MKDPARPGGLEVALLLADPSATLRLLVLRDLLDRPEGDPEVVELEGLRRSAPPIRVLIETQRADGGWHDPERRRGELLVSSQALLCLGYAGLGSEEPAVAQGADFLFARQEADGRWPLQWGSEVEGGYDEISLQTSIPLRALAGCGYASDPRTEKGYRWLLDRRLPEGSWPTGTASGVFGRVAGYRRLAHSRWGCAANTVGAALALAAHPSRRAGEPLRRALDLLLGRETDDQPGFEAARLAGIAPARGFLTYYGRHDPAVVLHLCAASGISGEDPRVSTLVDRILERRGPYGLWEHPEFPRASRWITFDILRSLRGLSLRGWLGLEPRTPFQPYPPRPRRF